MAQLILVRVVTRVLNHLLSGMVIGAVTFS